MLQYHIEVKSTLNPYEYSHLLATLEGLFRDDFNCFKCLKRYGAEEGLAAARGIAKRKSKGCFDFTTRTFLLDNVKYSSCLGNYTLQGVSYYYELFFNYEKGVLPFEGDLGRQPNKIVEILHIIDTIKKDKTKDKK